jgi:hypothetical protein
MPTPGHETDLVDAIQAPGDDSDTGLLLVIGETLRGPTVPTEVNSTADRDAVFGPRQSYGVLHDMLDVHFNTGGTRAIVSRTVASTAVAATRDLAGTSGNSLKVTASSTGDWGNNLKVQVTAPQTATRRVLIIDGATNATLEQTPEYDELSDFVGWTGTYAAITAGIGTGLPVVAAATSLAGGASNRNAIDTAAHITALNKFTPENGIGQLAAPGIFTEAVHLAMLAVANQTKTPRFAVLDLDPTMTASQKASYLATLKLNGHWGAAVSSRVLIRATDSGTRWVSGSGFFTGRAAYTDSIAGPGQAPAGQDFGEHPYVLDVEDTYTDTERGLLNDVGGICIVRINGRPRLYGARSMANTSVHPAFKWLTAARVTMRFKSLADDILEAHVLRRNNSGERIQLGNDLTGLAEQERNAKNLDGETPEEAYRIDTSDSVNTKQSIADGWIRADAEIRPPETAERVRLNLAVQVPGGTVSGV